MRLASYTWKIFSICKLWLLSYFTIISCKEVLEGQMIKKKITPTAIISRVLSQTLRISAFLSCIRSIRYAGASGKKLLRIKAVFFSQPWDLPTANFITKRSQEFSNTHVKFSSLPPTTLFFFFKSHFKIPKYSSKSPKENYMLLTKKIHSDLLQEIHAPNILSPKGIDSVEWFNLLQLLLL